MNIIRDIVFQIRSRRDDLSVTERKVADAILDNIIWSASATVDQLAAKAGVSIATISRFARTVGCDDTRDLKMKLAQASTVGSRFLDQSTPAEESTFYARIYADIESTLRAHLPTFTEPLFEAAAAIVDGVDGALFIKRHHHSVRSAACLEEEHHFIAHLQTSVFSSEKQ